MQKRKSNLETLLAQVLRCARLQQLLTANPRACVIATTCPCLDGVLRVLDTGHARQQLDKVAHRRLHNRAFARHADAFQTPIVSALDERALDIGVRVADAQVRAALEDARKQLDVAAVACQRVGVVAQRGVPVNYAALGQPHTNARTQVRVVVLKVNGRALRVTALDWQVLVHRPSGDSVVLDILALFGALIGPVSASIQKRTGSHAVACASLSTKTCDKNMKRPKLSNDA